MNEEMELSDFVRDIIKKDLAEGKNDGRVHTRFPPEPNGYLHIGSGGWFGKGYNSGTQVQLRFLKVRHSDFIFSALSEEFGFVGAIVVIAILAFIIARCLRAARLSSDTYGALIAYGAATLISFQTIVNIGMNLRLLPVTGLTLPFVSYGGSSLITLFIAIGLVESVLLRHKSLEF